MTPRSNTMESSSAVPRKHIFLGVFAIFCLSFSWLWALESAAKPRAFRGMYFQKWSSDDMMQAMPAAVLKKNNLKTLWYLHKEPPVFDGIRTLILQHQNSKDPKKLLRRLDKDLYRLNILLFAALTALLFAWIARVSSLLAAYAAAFIWMLHPAPLFYATFLDSTFLSALLMTWFFYELYKLNKNGSLFRFTLSFLAIFFTKIIFQWFSFPVIIAALLLKRIPLKKIAVFILIAGSLLFAFMFKQHVLFGTWSTTTFNGEHFCSIINYLPSDEEMDEIRQTIHLNYPKKASLYAEDIYNSEKQYEDNLIYEKAFKNELLRRPARSLGAIWQSFKYNWGYYWKPSSDYLIFTRRLVFLIKVVSDENVLTEALPWKQAYEFVFSHGRFLGLLLFSGLIWLISGLRGKKEDYFRNGFSLFLPAAYVVLICCLANRYAWTESERLKFILEPVFFIFIACQLYRFLRLLKR